MKISQFCSVCKDVLEMTVVPTAEAEEDGVIWLRCPRCQGFLPKFSAGLGAASGATAAPAADETAADDGVAPPAAAPAGETPAPAAAAPPVEIDAENAVPYRPWGRYDVGACVHHLAWDDYGVVLAKEKLPGGRKAIRVRFEKAGEVRLIEEGDEAS